MSDVNASAAIKADQSAAKTPTKQGALTNAAGKEHTCSAFENTGPDSQGVSKFLGEINEPPDLPEAFLSERTFTTITQETVEVETEILHLFEELEKQEAPPKGKEADGKQTLTGTKQTPQAPKNSEAKPLAQTPQNAPETPKSEKPEVYTSLFSLAQSFNKGLTETRKQTSPQPQQKQAKAREESRSNSSLGFSSPEKSSREMLTSETHHDYQEQDDEQKEGSGGQQHKQQDEKEDPREQFNMKASRKVSPARAAREPVAASGPTLGPKANEALDGAGNIFIRFMALMARILGQSEAEAHDLYNRIKERTDNIDHLTLLISKINSEGGALDWSENEEMKALVEKAREIGVDIPEGKLQWSEDEARLLKENIHLRKDSMEKVTQMERTDMQRYLQEASQCHQARSNVLKLLKEVMDTIIHNMRP